MFPFFNDDFFKTLLGEQKSFRIQAPNGGVYHFSTNLLDDRTFNSYKQKLKTSVENKDQVLFDQIWNEMQNSKPINSGMSFNLDQIQKEMENLFEDASEFFGKNGNPIQEFLNAMNKQTNLNSKDSYKDEYENASIDEKINQLEKELSSLRTIQSNNETRNKKEGLETLLSEKKSFLDQKLGELSENILDQKKKKEITDELTKILRDIETIENELRQL